MSLPIERRLRHHKEFSWVYKHGIHRSSQHLVVKALDCRKHPMPRKRYPGKRHWDGHLSRGDRRLRSIQVEDHLPNHQAFPAVTKTSEKPIPDPPISQPYSHDRVAQRQDGQRFCRLRPTRFGISISQKVSKKAVVRNRIKRQIKAAIRSFLGNLAEGWWVVIIVRPSAIRCDYGQFLQELEQMLRAIEVIDGHS